MKIVDVEKARKDISYFFEALFGIKLTPEQKDLITKVKERIKKRSYL